MIVRKGFCSVIINDEYNIERIQDKVMQYKKKDIYKKIEIDYIISEELNKFINEFVEYLNNSDGESEDYYRYEIDFWLKDYKDRLTDEQYNILREYYVRGGIYA